MDSAARSFEDSRRSCGTPVTPASVIAGRMARAPRSKWLAFQGARPWIPWLACGFACGFAWLAVFGSAHFPGGLSQAPGLLRAEDSPPTPGRRTPWSSSRVRGTPEPPPPLVAVNAFPGLRFHNPVALAVEPGGARMWVAEQTGKLFSFPLPKKAANASPAAGASPAANALPAADSAPPPVASQALDLTELLAKTKSAAPSSAYPVDNRGLAGLEALYGLAFHPRFAENGYCYLTYVVRDNSGQQRPDGTRVSRFTVTKTDPPMLDPASERIIITWLQGGHNGGCLAFGPDGCLYISTGDGGFANPPDGRDAGQDVSNLLSSILRIDVDHPVGGGQEYSIPADNPLVGLPGARGEIWCYGLRNPWKMSFDRATGDLWVADVGWELWELVYRVAKGGNYGWSVVEGRQSVHPQRKVGPTPILPPTLEIPHTDGVSITGGYVYRGKRFPELVGSYIFGDWETRRIWASRWDATTQTASPPVDVIAPTVRLVAFAEDPDGELFMLDYDDGTLLVPERVPAQDANASFPRKLSETGLFQSVADHSPATGVVPFDVNVEQWSDGARAERWIGIPGPGTVQFLPNKKALAGSMFSGQQRFPPDTVLIKTLSVPNPTGNKNPEESSNWRRVESQLLHFDGRAWRGYSYAWNDNQTDAELVDATGRETALSPTLTWRFASRVECARCHNPWAEFTLGFNLRQLHRPTDRPGKPTSQLEWFSDLGIIELPPPPDAGPQSSPHTAQPANSDPNRENPSQVRRAKLAHAETFERFVGLDNPGADLAQKVRSYLHVNCAHCHRVGGGGTASFELRYELPIEATKTVGVRPSQGTFDLPDARIIAAGDPYRSTLFYRMAKTGAGRMPHIGSEAVDWKAVAAIERWIRELPQRGDEQAKWRELRTLAEKSIATRSATSTPSAPQKAMLDDLVQRRATLIRDLLADPGRALFLLRAVQESPLPEPAASELLAASRGDVPPGIRDLFAPLQPPEFRPQRPAAPLDPTRILALSGDASRGRRLFFETASVQCKNCHRIDGVGSPLGPDLSNIGSKYPRGPLLDQILDPSRIIEPRYVAYVAQLDDGRTLTGMLVDRNPQSVTLRDAKGDMTRIASEQLESLAPLRQSLMPDQQLRDLSPEQIADLLAYLAERKSPPAPATNSGPTNAP